MNELISVTCLYLQEVAENPTKEEKAVAKYLRFNVATKEGKLVGMPVQYFIGNYLLSSNNMKYYFFRNAILR